MEARIKALEERMDALERQLKSVENPDLQAIAQQIAERVAQVER
jgi:hypothetical protein